MGCELMRDILTTIKTWWTHEPKHQSLKNEHLEYQKTISFIAAMIIFTSIFSVVLFIYPINFLFTTQPETVLIFWVSCTGMELYQMVLVRYEYIKNLLIPTPTDKEVT